MQNTNQTKIIFGRDGAVRVIVEEIKRVYRGVPLWLKLGLFAVALVVCTESVLVLARMTFAAAPVVQLTVASITDGTSPFDADNNPGNDSANNNLRVRAQDGVTYNIQGAIHQNSITNPVITATLNDKGRWVSLPSFCYPASSSISTDRKTIVCGLASKLAQGITLKMDFVAAALGSAVDGDQLSASFVLSYAEGSVTANASNVTISVATRIDLETFYVGPYTVSDNIMGRDGVTPGQLHVYAMSMAALNGSENPSGNTISFTGSITNNSLTSQNTAEVYNWGTSTIPSCGVLGYKAPVSYPNLPVGSLGYLNTGTASSIWNSGSISCSQSSPGGAVTFTVSGYDNTGVYPPSNNLNNSTIALGKTYFGVYYVAVWVPLSDITTGPVSGGFSTLNVTLNNSAINATGVSGGANYSGAGEPLVNNQNVGVLYQNAAMTGGGGAAGGNGMFMSVTAYSDNNDYLGSSYAGTTNNTSLLYAGVGTLRAVSNYDQFLRFQTSSDYKKLTTTSVDMISCIKYDPANLKIGLSKYGTIAAAAYTGNDLLVENYRNGSGFNVYEGFKQKFDGIPSWDDGTSWPRFNTAPGNNDLQYSSTANTPSASTATCEDADGPWYDSIAAVPGGVSSITKIRGKFSITPATLPSYITSGNTTYLGGYFSTANMTFSPTTSAPFGTALPIYFSIKENGTWIPSNHFDFIRVPVQARGAIYGYDTFNQKYNTFLQASKNVSVPVTLKATLTGDTNPVPTTFTYTLNLPATVSYDAGSASVTPDSVTVNSDSTTTVVWTKSNVTVGSPLSDITLSITPTVFKGYLDTTLVVSSPLDTTSTLSEKTKYLTLSMSTPGALAITSSAPRTIISPDENFSLQVKYDNIGSSNFTATDFIGVFPNLQEATRAFPAPRSTLTEYSGTVAFNSASGSNGETFLYTKASPQTINMNPGCPSNGGSLSDTLQCQNNTTSNSTVWCSGFTGGTCPASAAESTAIRIQGGAFATSASTRTVTLNFLHTGQSSFSFDFGGFASPGIVLGSFSNDVSITVSPSTIGGLVFLDPNNNNTIDSNEGGISGVTVGLTGTENGPDGTFGTGDDVAYSGTATVVSNVTGAFAFTNLKAGRYTLTATQPAGSSVTGDTDGVGSPHVIANITLTSGVNNSLYRFGYIGTGQLVGNVTQTDTAAGISGLIMELRDSTGVGIVQQATSTGTGTYQFIGLLPNTYVVRGTTTAGYAINTATAGTLGGAVALPSITGVVMPNGGFGSGYDFGLSAVTSSSSSGGYVFSNTQPTISVSPTPQADNTISVTEQKKELDITTTGTLDIVTFLDTNRNYVKDSKEKIAARQKITLKKEGETNQQQIFTNKQGIVSVTNLPPGMYVISWQKSTHKADGIQSKTIEIKATGNFVELPLFQGVLFNTGIDETMLEVGTSLDQGSPLLEVGTDSVGTQTSEGTHTPIGTQTPEISVVPNPVVSPENVPVPVVTSLEIMQTQNDLKAIHESVSQIEDPEVHGNLISEILQNMLQVYGKSSLLFNFFDPNVYGSLKTLRYCGLQSVSEERCMMLLQIGR